MENNMNVRIAEIQHDTVFEQFESSDPNQFFVSGEGYVQGYHFGHHFIGDFLPDEKIDQVTNETPVMIISQTGTGKTTLVMEKILPKVKNRCKRMLILVSRTALATQYKRDIAEREMPELLEELTAIGIKRKTDFGAVEVWTYQHLYYELLKPERDFQEFDTTIFDECQHFVQDAAYDVFTYETLRLAIKKLHHCRRFYLTATPEMVADKIAEEEWKQRSEISRLPPEYFLTCLAHPHFVIFEFGKDYSYVNPLFFCDEKEITDLIIKSEEKFLICVDSKERGERIHNAIGDGTAEYINAELKNNEKAEVVEEMIANGKFEKRVLVVTSFLDVGINLKDDGLHNVVIFSTNKTHFLQAIGRKKKKR